MFRYACMILSLILGISMLAGCEKQPEEEPMDGENTTHQDPNAPKEIASDEITQMHTYFYLATRWYGEEDGFFDFEIDTTAAKETNTNISVPSNTELLQKLQAVIRNNDLISKNGLYDVTAGLPPEYQPCGMTVTYKSGEKLTFTEDNNPFALWSEEMYDILAEHFAKNGETGLYPNEETTLLTKMNIHFIDGDLEYSYGGINVSDADAIKGETHLLERNIYDLAKNKEIREEYILFPQGYYEKLTEIIRKQNLVRTYDFSRYDHEENNFGNHDDGYYGMGPQPKDEQDSKTKSLRFSMTFESGKRLSIETKKESEIEAFRPLINELISYIDGI